MRIYQPNYQGQKMTKALSVNEQGKALCYVVVDDKGDIQFESTNRRECFFYAQKNGGTIKRVVSISDQSVEPKKPTKIEIEMQLRLERLEAYRQTNSSKGCYIKIRIPNGTEYELYSLKEMAVFIGCSYSTITNKFRGKFYKHIGGIEVLEYKRSKRRYRNV